MKCCSSFHSACYSMIFIYACLSSLSWSILCWPHSPPQMHSGSNVGLPLVKNWGGRLERIFRKIFFKLQHFIIERNFAISGYCVVQEYKNATSILQTCLTYRSLYYQRQWQEKKWCKNCHERWSISPQSSQETHYDKNFIETATLTQLKISSRVLAIMIIRSIYIWPFRPEYWCSINKWHFRSVVLNHFSITSP